MGLKWDPTDVGTPRSAVMMQWGEKNQLEIDQQNTFLLRALVDTTYRPWSVAGPAFWGLISNPYAL